MPQFAKSLDISPPGSTGHAAPFLLSAPPAHPLLTLNGGVQEDGVDDFRESSLSPFHRCQDVNRGIDGFRRISTLFVIFVLSTFMLLCFFTSVTTTARGIWYVDPYLDEWELPAFSARVEARKNSLQSLPPSRTHVALVNENRQRTNVDFHDQHFFSVASPDVNSFWRRIVTYLWYTSYSAFLSLL